jgi:Cu-Zn family superoxide dismutase
MPRPCKASLDGHAICHRFTGVGEHFRRRLNLITETNDMKSFHFQPIGALTAALCLVTAPATLGAEHKSEDKHSHSHAGAQLEKIVELLAVVQPANGSHVRGSVLFEKVPEGVKVTAKIGGLEANAKHAIHIHEFGNIIAEDGTSAGGHYNPEGHEHGLPDEDDKRHAGDFGNLETDADGNAEMVLTLDNISLATGENPIIGRAVIVHAKEDDGGQPTGNAGDRIAMGVIGVSKVKAEAHAE